MGRSSGLRVGGCENLMVDKSMSTKMSWKIPNLFEREVKGEVEGNR